MAWRFADLVVDGEIDNTLKGRVSGWIRLSGRSEPLLLDLRGDCHPDLAGWRCRIARTDPAPPWTKPVDLSGLSTEQIGDAGEITADRLLRHCDCPVEELVARIRAGEPPPTEWRKGLYLEWYSERNGRVVIQDTRLAVERLGQRAFELTEEDLRHKREAAERELEEMHDQGFVIEEDEPGIISFHRQGDEDDDPPQGNLQSYLDQQTRDIDRAVQDSLDDEATDDGEKTC